TRNVVGKILYSIIAVDVSKSSYKRKCDKDLLLGSTQIIIAIKAFKNDTGNYPLSLNNLTPRYLSSIPIDPFNKKPLKYSAEKKIIYSVGIDLKDSGGSIGDSWREMADPTFKIDF
ncbi:MAG: hypothetical protein U9P88_01410, partial [Patescibacteria group bacterium]|nr:hypothetical protein [Patescibacteria group bacterium]